MDGISSADLPSLVIIVGGIALFAILVLWVMPRLAFPRRQELVLFAAFAVLFGGGIAIDLIDGQTPPLGISGLFLLCCYQLWRTWRLRHTI